MGHGHSTHTSAPDLFHCVKLYHLKLWVKITFPSQSCFCQIFCHKNTKRRKIGTKEQSWCCDKLGLMFAVEAAGHENPKNAVNNVQWAILVGFPEFWKTCEQWHLAREVSEGNMILWRTGLETMHVIFWQPIGTNSLHALGTKQQIKDKGIRCRKFQSSGTSRVWHSCHFPCS